MAAAAAVLALPELVEQIVLQLPSSTIFTTAQRICKQWQQIIAESAHIQHELGMPSKLKTLISPTLFGDDHSPAYTEPVSIVKWIDFNHGGWWDGKDKGFKMLRARRLIGQRDFAASMGYYDGASDDEGASYRQMLVTEPAGTTLLVSVDVFSRSHPPWRHVVAMTRGVDGVTFGLVEDTMVKMLKPALMDGTTRVIGGFQVLHTVHLG